MYNNYKNNRPRHSGIYDIYHLPPNFNFEEYAINHYIGESGDIAERWGSHLNGLLYYHPTSRKRPRTSFLEEYDTRSNLVYPQVFFRVREVGLSQGERKIKEKNYIYNERPSWNKTHNPDYKRGE